MPGAMPQKNPKNITQIDDSAEGLFDISTVAEIPARLGNAIATMASTTLKNALQAGINCTSIGANGTLLDVSSNAEITGIFTTYGKPDYKRVGYPLNADRKLGDLSGFVKTINAELHADGMTLTEHSAICEMLNGGVFVE